MERWTQTEDSVDKLVLRVQGHPQQDGCYGLNPFAGDLNDFVEDLQCDVCNLFES